MSLLTKFLEAKSLTILVYVSEHVGILITSQPFILPIEPQSFTVAKETLLHIFISHSPGVDYHSGG